MCALRSPQERKKKKFLQKFGEVGEKIDSVRQLLSGSRILNLNILKFSSARVMTRVYSCRSNVCMHSMHARVSCDIKELLNLELVSRRRRRRIGNQPVSALLQDFHFVFFQKSIFTQLLVPV